MKIKIFGAGSIGNHLAQAARRMTWQVTVVDTDPKALGRMKNEIYPMRYGQWDDAIELRVSGTEQKGSYDVIMIGTPPHVRTAVALEALKENPKVMLLEKPVTYPFDPKLKTLSARLKTSKTIALVGYDHAVAKSVGRAVDLLKSGIIGEPLTLDVEFREHWEGIFKAHPWLSGPQDSYLGYWQRGGGASGEHSHALHLAMYLSQQAKLGAWDRVHANLQTVKKGKIDYDSIASFSFSTEKGKTGRVIQDVVTKPTRKWARVQGTNGYVEWICSGHASGDIVRFAGSDGAVRDEIFEKKRPDDFYAEMLHIDGVLKKKINARTSPIAFSTGVDVMRILEKARRA
jgi:predicted dehydrogenase